VLREAESGDTVVEICSKHGISQQSFYLWKRKYASLGLHELRELRQSRDENVKLRRLVADLSLDRHILQEIVEKNCKAPGPDASWRSGHSRCTNSARGGWQG
jgi:putative transposase